MKVAEPARRGKGSREFRPPGEDPGSGPEDSVRLSRRVNSWLVSLPLPLFAWLARRLPQRWSLKLGAGLGKLTGWFSRRPRKRALQMLEQCLNGELTAREREIVIASMFQHFGREVFDLLRLSQQKAHDVQSSVQVQGLEHLEAARHAGRGVLLITGHLGNWERMAAWVAGQMPLSVLARYLPNRHLNAWLVGVRARHGVQTLYRGSLQSAREALRRLRKGEALGLLIDQDTRVEGAFVTFFGRPAFTPTGAAGLAQRTGATLLPCFIHREGLRHFLVFEPPVELPQGLSREETRIAATAELTLRIEQAVRRHPEQWVWIHRRFRTKPRTIQDSV